MNPPIEAHPPPEPPAIRDSEPYISTVVIETFTLRDAFLDQYIAREKIKASLLD